MNPDRRVALVTGSGRGIGRAIALGMANLGHRVAVNFRSSSSAAESLVSEIGSSEWFSHGLQGRCVRCIRGGEVFSEIETAMGSVDILVNNAGITRDGLIMRMKDPDWEDVIRTNLLSVFFLPPGRPSEYGTPPLGPNSQYHCDRHYR